MSKTNHHKFYKITVFNWIKNNPKYKDFYKKTPIANNFCTDSTLQELPISARWMYLGLILLCGSSNKQTIIVGVTTLKQLSSKGVAYLDLVRLLEQFQLLSYASFTSLNELKEVKVEEEEKEKPLTNWFQKFVTEELNSLDTGLFMIAPKIEKCFGGEPGFREWLKGVTSTKKFLEINGDEQLRYFKKSLNDELKNRGLS